MASMVELLSKHSADLKRVRHQEEHSGFWLYIHTQSFAEI